MDLIHLLYTVDSNKVCLKPIKSLKGMSKANMKLLNSIGERNYNEPVDVKLCNELAEVKTEYSTFKSNFSILEEWINNEYNSNFIIVISQKTNYETSFLRCYQFEEI